MTTNDVRRKLTAILSADVQGYSRLMGDDERATVETITAYRKVMTDLIKDHHGRVVDAKGDNVLAEFPSVVDAIQCAVEIQKELKVKNADLPKHRRMEFRIGINLGDVIEKEETIYGDGVNIAARLESLAEGGGICISGTAFDQVGKKLPLGYEYLGEQPVKNIEKPIRVYKALVELEAVGKVIGEKRRLKKRHLAVFVGLAILVVAGALAFWKFYLRPDVTPASIEKMAYPLPDKPSIAVLPFVNLSGDPDQEYFSDGLAEEIITALSKVPQLFVIARNSSFSYKSKSVKVKQIAEDLGVRYVLEGSVRKEGDRVRITAQLIDALTGYHLWAERYDRKLEDIFALQDEITMKILIALQLKLTDGELARVSAKGTRNLEAYLKVLQARGPFYTVTKEGCAQARRLCEEALAIDPDYAAAYVYLGSTHFIDVILGSSKSPKESLKLAFECLTKAKTLDDSYAAAHSVLGFIYVMKKQYDKGMAECERAIALDPNSATALIWMSLVRTFSGNHQEAVQPAEHALRLNPLAPPFWNRILGIAYSWVGRYEEAISAFKKSLQRAPDDISTHIALTGTYSSAGRLEAARAQAQEVLRINPKYCLKQDRRISLWKNQADRERILDGLRKAGLPETPPLPLPDKPSIAVLPFVNMSGDPEQEYFSDGITEEIITALSKTPKLFVIARNSTFTYKGKPVKVQQVGRELGVKYVLEGSVRKSGDKVRITAQLVDAQTGRHLWAERYDRELKDIFAIQDDITKQIITALQIKLTLGEIASGYARQTNSLEAFLRLMRARDHHMRFTKEDNLISRRLTEEVISIDPEYGQAYVLLAATYMLDIHLGAAKSPKEYLGKAIELAKKAVTLDGARAHGMLGWLYSMARRYDKAVAECQQAVDLNPNSASAHSWYGMVLMSAGRYPESVLELEQAVRLDPFPSTWILRSLGRSYTLTGRYEEAIAALKKAIQKAPNDQISHLSLVLAYSFAGQREEAQAEAAEVLRINPKFSLESYIKRRAWKNQAEKDKAIEAYHQAGLK